jgi:4-amino-4-deoxy-L-arabinose transferase-like glycosyltransferase
MRRFTNRPRHRPLNEHPTTQRFATTPVAILAASVAGVLIALSERYGYHRDELYFLAAGERLDWGYADQGPLTPAIAAAADAISPDSILVLRLPSALAAAAMIVLTALIARELGGGRRPQLVAAACVAVGVVFLQVGHLLSTATFDLLAWTAVTWLAVRAVRTEDDRLWLVAGVVLGLGLLNKPLPAFLILGLVAGVAISGPRRLLLNPWVWAGGLVALALWSPWLIWQTSNGWPQIDVSSEIAAGGSASSEPRWAILPFQFLLVSPLLAPIWIAGLWGLFRDARLRDYRFLAWAWAILAVVFIASGGKPYYLAGLLPVLLAAGSVVIDPWLERGRSAHRRASLAVAVGLSAIVGAVIALPVLPVDEVEPVVEVNEDVGETVGWPEMVETVAEVAEDAPGDPVILTANYGEAGAIDRYGSALGLPRAYSGHNAYADWGRPPGEAGPVIAVGISDRFLDGWLRNCRPAAELSNDAGIENDEFGAPVALCASPIRPWSELDLEHYG